MKYTVGVIQDRLLDWQHQRISLGGRIVFLNLVLNGIPIFYLSYTRMPTKDWKEVVKIQRLFFFLIPEVVLMGRRFIGLKISMGEVV